MIKLKKCSKAIFAVLLMGLLAGCGKTEANIALPKATEDDYKPLITLQESEGFEYRFDPLLSAESMKDVIVDEKAVYGFSPNPDSDRLGAYAEYDWSDPAVVEPARQDRIAYHESIATMYTMLKDMLAEGKDIETIARAISAERNRIRLAAYDNDPEGLEKVKKSNLKSYGDENGPSADSLFEKYGSWETVLSKAFSANIGMDICLGLYDDYYYSYIELGLIPDIFAEMKKNCTMVDMAQKYGSALNEAFIISSDGYKVGQTAYMDEEEIYVCDPDGSVYTTIDGELYCIDEANDFVGKYCLVGNGEYPDFPEFTANDFDNGATDLVGFRKYDDNNILVTLSIKDNNYITSFEQGYGYNQGEIKELVMKKLIASDTYEQKLSDLYMVTEDDCVKIGQAIGYTAVSKPEIDKAALDKINDTSRRTVDIIADNGTAEEVTYTFDLGREVIALTMIGDEFEAGMYEDPKYKKEHTDVKKAVKKTILYIRKK